MSRTLTNMTPSGTIHMAYDLSGHLLVESDGAGNTVREYIWLNDRPIAVVDDVNTASPKLYHVHVDHLQRPVMMTDASKVKVWEASFEPFGKPYSITGTATLNARFPGITVTV